jgi:hypothetical protein
MTPTMNLALPGSTYGPCLGECNHPRCAHWRRTAVLICPLCDKEIGYSVDYVKEDRRNGRLVHTNCAPRRECADGTAEVCSTCAGERVIKSTPAGAGHEDDLAEYVPCPDCSCVGAIAF